MFNIRNNNHFDKFERGKKNVLHFISILKLYFKFLEHSLTSRFSL